MINNKENELIKNAKAGDPKSINDLFILKSKFIMYVIKRTSNSLDIWDDLYQELYIKFSDIIKKYNINYSFNVFLDFRIRSLVNNYITTNNKYMSTTSLNCIINDDDSELMMMIPDETNDTEYIDVYKFKYLTDKHYDILNLHLNLNYSFVDIGKKYKTSRQCIYDIYNRIINKIKIQLKLQQQSSYEQNYKIDEQNYIKKY